MDLCCCYCRLSYYCRYMLRMLIFRPPICDYRNHYHYRCYVIIIIMRDRIEIHVRLVQQTLGSLVRRFMQKHGHFILCNNQPKKYIIHIHNKKSLQYFVECQTLEYQLTLEST